MPSERLRLEMYKRLAEVRADEDVDLIREEMVDRYGEPPAEVESLLQVARFRGRARQAGLTDVTLQGKYVRFSPVELPTPRPCGSTGSTRRACSSPRCVRCWCPARRRPSWAGTPIRDEALLAWAREVVDAVIDPAGAPVQSRRSKPGSNPAATRRRVAVTRSRTVLAAVAAAAALRALGVQRAPRLRRGGR